jgi:hypothetical protein
VKGRSGAGASSLHDGANLRKRGHDGSGTGGGTLDGVAARR